MNAFFTLLIGHLIADFPLQPDWVYHWKTRHWTGIAFHVSIHVAVTSLLVRDPFSHWPILLSLGLAHFAIDWTKLRFDARLQTPGFLLDQLAHFTTLGLLAALAPGLPVILPATALYPFLLYAALPALLMFVWILALDAGRNTEHPSSLVHWARRRLLRLSQLAGIPLLVGVMLERILAS